LTHHGLDLGEATTFPYIVFFAFAHGTDLGEATTFPYIVFFAFAHGTYIQMAFCLGTPKEKS
jgi:hypothetical protein